MVAIVCPAHQPGEKPDQAPAAGIAGVERAAGAQHVAGGAQRSGDLRVAQVVKHREGSDEVEPPVALQGGAGWRHRERDVAQARRFGVRARLGNRDRREIEPDDLGDMRREIALDRPVAATQAEDAMHAASAGTVQELASAALVHAAEELAALDPGRVGFIVVVVVVALVHPLFSPLAARHTPPDALHPVAPNPKGARGPDASRSGNG